MTMSYFLINNYQAFPDIARRKLCIEGDQQVLAEPGPDSNSSQSVGVLRTGLQTAHQKYQTHGAK